MAMEKFKKRFNTSPLIKKKGVTTNGSAPNSGLRSDESGALMKTFGASLEELTLRERSDVPLIVRKICEYITERGLGVEGLFRINGNVRLIQSLKATYEAEGDVELTECNDIHSIAGLLKRFVRDLSDGLIPENFTIDFIKTIEANCDSVETSLVEIKKLIECLPPEAYATLRYLCFFLWEVSLKEAENKMSAGSLGIVFGPNVFRCSENSINAGLSLSYTHCNRAMSLMIAHCHHLFDKPQEPSHSPGANRPSSPPSHTSPKVSPPPRPPPPVFTAAAAAAAPTSPPHVPRLIVQSAWGRQPSDEQPLSARSESPFLPDTSEAENSLSRDTASMLPAPTVSNMISHVISDNLFGGDFATSETEPVTEPSPKPRKRRSNEADIGAGLDGTAGINTPDLDQDVTDLLNASSAFLSPRGLEEEEEPECDVTMPSAAPRRQRKPKVTPRRAASQDREVNNNVDRTAEASQPGSDVKLVETPSEADHSFGEVIARFPRETEEDKTAALVLDIRRQIQSLKRNVRRFEEDYVRRNGRKPTMREKNADKTMRVCLSDLALCRQKLRALQEGLEEPTPLLRASARSKSAEFLHVNGSAKTLGLQQPQPRLRPKLSLPRDTAGETDAVSLENGVDNAGHGGAPSFADMKAALANLEHELQVKRELAGRPEDLNAMTWDEVREEKVTLQRALLNYETSHGRPSTVEEKEVMRPVYDRYRTVKRILVSGRRTGPMSRSVAGASSLSAEDPPPSDLFAVTQDFQARVRREGLMQMSLASAPAANRSPPQSKPRVALREGTRAPREHRRSHPITSSNSLEASSIDHLQEEETRLRTEKKRLQRLLKQFERDFENTHGRKVAREDREPMHNEYLSYKRIKMKLKDLGQTINMYS